MSTLPAKGSPDVMGTTSVTLAPIIKTQFARRIIHGGRGLTERKECWGAETTDGVWSFDREDSPGTPWLVYHQPSVKDGSLTTPVSLQGSLRACRWYVAMGWAEADLERLLAHEQGEHAGERDPRCVKC